jgi:tetratricopeptide (TPR) repeat protein
MPVKNPEVPANLQTVMALHEGLKAYGISYLISPNRPFAKEVVDAAAVDSLKFPRQTLGFRAGDCADLSVLYASCFEAAGMATAFITVPGHILVAADLGISASEARGRGMNHDELIFLEDKVWIPLETTLRNAGFREAWREGASQWRKASTVGAAALYPIHEAWGQYPPVGLPADGSNIQLPPVNDVLKGFEAELSAVVENELSVRIALLGPLVRGEAYARGVNGRGVLYAKYGLYERAVEYLKDAVQSGSSSALVNLGNILMLQSDPAGAYRYYIQAIATYPRNARLQANLARAAAALGRHDEARLALQELRNLDPQLADQYDQILKSGSPNGAGMRAASIETDFFWF